MLSNGNIYFERELASLFTLMTRFHMRNTRTILLASLCISFFSGCNEPEDGGNSTRINSNSCSVIDTNIVSIPAGSAIIGSETGYPEERPERQIEIAKFDMDATEVTNAQFSTFVRETGYVTSAEKKQPGFDAKGAAVFVPPDADRSSMGICSKSR